MAKIPNSFSMSALPIRAALEEGRTDDAKTLIVELLRTGKADAVVQRLAADLIKPAPKPRGRQSARTRYWYEIGSHFADLRENGTKYDEALTQTADKFSFSETHVRKAISEFETARSASLEDRE